MTNKQAFIVSYITCALWSSTNDKGEPLENNSLFQPCQEQLAAYAGAAFDAEVTLLEQFVNETDSDFYQAGHTFWLSTNGHGAGFFDFTDSPAALALDSKCDQYGMGGAIYKGFDLYVGDDGLIYC